MAAATENSIHPFEASGLGLSPFRLVGYEEKVYVACPGAPARAAGTCDHCGTGIRHCFIIRSSDKKEFIVGCDCVRKLNRIDNVLLGEVEREMRRIEAAKREAKRQEKWNARREAIEAEHQAQRERNGGLTDHELAESNRRQAQADLYAEIRESNRWLIDVLDQLPYASDFVTSMIDKLGRDYVRDLSPRCVEVLTDIYAKAIGGRRSSKGYAEAAMTFRAKASAK